MNVIEFMKEVYRIKEHLDNDELQNVVITYKNGDVDFHNVTDIMVKPDSVIFIDDVQRPIEFRQSHIQNSVARIQCISEYKRFNMNILKNIYWKLRYRKWHRSMKKIHVQDELYNLYTLCIYKKHGKCDTYENVRFVDYCIDTLNNMLILHLDTNPTKDITGSTKLYISLKELKHIEYIKVPGNDV